MIRHKNNNGTLDRRFRINKPVTAPVKSYWEENARILLCVAILGFLFACVTMPTVWRWFHPQPLLSPLAKPIGFGVVQEVQAVGVTTTDPLRYIRSRGEALGFSNQEVMLMIRIARAESKCNTKTKKTCIPDNGVSGIGLDPEAKNPNSTATGIFQILTGTWDSNRCVGERWDFIDNINCAWTIYGKRGSQPWNASKGGWNK